MHYNVARRPVLIYQEPHHSQWTHLARKKRLRLNCQPN